MNAEGQGIFVRKTIDVDAPLAHVFGVFANDIDAWWPRAHHIGPCEAFEAILEPRVGGRWYERGDDGSECPWGRVLAYEPPHRLLLAWDIGADFRPDASIGSEVEVTFVALSAKRTRVTLTHRHLERYGDKAEAMRAMFDSENAWAQTLAGFRDAVARVPAAGS
ncbi:MAG TPA: SRPBCC family protein [Casimicrobiaceae bacterium]|jgi:uncharacterized protein YndB with AHSA1/START domain|nr:SRPBCC family protein [Casimicrobiaceae bacterium]